MSMISLDVSVSVSRQKALDQIVKLVHSQRGKPKYRQRRHYFSQQSKTSSKLVTDTKNIVKEVTISVFIFTVKMSLPADPLFFVIR